VSIQAIRLGNADFELERKRLPVDDLRLDPDNQRLSYLLKLNGATPTEQKLQELIWDMDAVKDLYTSIYQNGGLINDPIVTRDFVVVEGNCRTVCLRELRKRYPDDERWKWVNVQLLPARVSAEQLTMFIGELHIAGKIEWRAFEQAEFVWKMNSVYGKSFDFLASHLRWTRAKLAQKIGAYEETKLYLEETRDPEGINRFSHFEEFMKKKELRERRDTDPAFMPQFRGWVRDSHFPDAKDVRFLPDILENVTAFSAFKSGGAPAAREVLQNANPALVSNFWSTVDRATRELREIPLVEVEDLRRGHLPKLERLSALEDAILLLRREILGGESRAE
jgi:hypothetical protein